MKQERKKWLTIVTDSLQNLKKNSRTFLQGEIMFKRMLLVSLTLLVLLSVASAQTTFPLETVYLGYNTNNYRIIMNITNFNNQTHDLCAKLYVEARGGYSVSGAMSNGGIMKCHLSGTGTIEDSGTLYQGVFNNVPLNFGQVRIAIADHSGNALSTSYYSVGEAEDQNQGD